MARKALPHRMCDQRVPLAEPILKMPQAPAGQISQPAPLGTLRASKVPRKAGTARKNRLERFFTSACWRAARRVSPTTGRINPPWMACRSDQNLLSAANPSPPKRKRKTKKTYIPIPGGICPFIPRNIFFIPPLAIFFIILLI